MITLRINAAGKLVDEGGGILPAAVRPELAAGIKFYEIELIPVAGVAAGTYTLSGDIEFRRVDTMFLAESTVETDGSLRFQVSTDTLGFWEKMRCRQPGTALFLRCTAATANGEAVSILEDKIYARPGISGSGDAPAPNPGAITTLNGLNGAVKFYDADGNLIETDEEENAMKLPEVAGPQGNQGNQGIQGIQGPRGLTVIADPVTELPVCDAAYGYCRYLDATYPRLAFVARIRNLVRVRLEVVSANPAITGTVVIVPVIDGVDGEPITIDVGATLAEAVFDLAIASGTLALRRTGGTLADGGMVTCIVTNVVLEVQYA